MKNMRSGFQVLALIMSAIFAETVLAKDGEWVDIFNGKNLDGWTPKFAGYALGYNLNNIFRVEDGLLKVSYDDADEFKGDFGHLFYKTPYSHYRIRAVFRFTGEQQKGGPAWAYRTAACSSASADQLIRQPPAQGRHARGEMHQ